MTEEPVERPTQRKRTRRQLPFIMFFLLFVAGAYLTFAYIQARNELSQLKQTTAQSPDQEANALINKISAHMALPAEKPTIATVEDTKKLADQTFFKNAHNGDKVLMYTKSKKVILYRPSEDKVIEVAYLNIKK